MFCPMPNAWAASSKSKHEKCQIIASEIYKRINITFAIKELKSKEIGSEDSDCLDSNDLSNETDLFAYERSDSLSSGLDEDRKINNNNEEIKKPPRPSRVKKRFRKRVKKKQKLVNDCSSDEEPLSRIVCETKKRLKIKIRNDLDGHTHTDYKTSEDSTSRHTDIKVGTPESETTESLNLNTSDGGKIDNFRDKPGTSKSECESKADSVIDLSVRSTDNAVQRSRRIDKSRVECNDCKITFSNVGGLRRHLKKSCRKKVILEPDLKKKHVCVECGRRYSQPSGLRVHQMTHRGIWHECSTCHKRFTRQDAWKRHQRVHNKPSGANSMQTTSVGRRNSDD